MLLDKVCDLLRPFDAALIRRYPVGSRVNLVKNDDPACAEAVARAADQGGGWVRRSDLSGRGHT
jgi:hypothetical protein